MLSKDEIVKEKTSEVLGESQYKEVTMRALLDNETLRVPVSGRG